MADTRSAELITRVTRDASARGLALWEASPQDWYSTAKAVYPMLDASGALFTAQRHHVESLAISKLSANEREGVGSAKDAVSTLQERRAWLPWDVVAKEDALRSIEALRQRYDEMAIQMHSEKLRQVEAARPAQMTTHGSVPRSGERTSVVVFGEEQDAEIEGTFVRIVPASGVAVVRDQYGDHYGFRDVEAFGGVKPGERVRALQEDGKTKVQDDDAVVSEIAMMAAMPTAMRQQAGMEMA